MTRSMRDLELTPTQLQQFRDDGFLILDRLLEPGEIARVAARFEPLFRGEFETGLYPDEWNWQDGRDPMDRTRQICNAWKADRGIASIVLNATVGRLCAQLGGWSGTRIAQDNVLWKPPGAKPLGFHQDNSYVHWVDPPCYVTCWMALDQTDAEGGTIEYVRGSHRWGKFPPIRQFHAPEDYKEALHAAGQRWERHRRSCRLRCRRAAARFIMAIPGTARVVIVLSGHADRPWHTASPRKHVFTHTRSATSTAAISAWTT